MIAPGYKYQINDFKPDKNLCIELIGVYKVKKI
jgi:hypothetical protein